MFGHHEDVDRPERTPVVERQLAREDDIDPRVRSVFTVRTRDMSAPDSSDCHTTWLQDLDDKTATWERFLTVPQPVGYDPSLIPGWDSPAAPGFGVLELRPTRLRVFPGTLLLPGRGTVLDWRA